MLYLVFSSRDNDIIHETNAVDSRRHRLHAKNVGAVLFLLLFQCLISPLFGLVSCFCGLKCILCVIIPFTFLEHRIHDEISKCSTFLSLSLTLSNSWHFPAMFSNLMKRLVFALRYTQTLGSYIDSHSVWKITQQPSGQFIEHSVLLIHIFFGSENSSSSSSSSSCSNDHFV